MPHTIDSSLSGRAAPLTEETTATDLHLDGTVPDALSGLYLGIGPSSAIDRPHASTTGPTDLVVHAVALRPGRAPSYRTRSITTHAACGPAAVNLIALGGRILALRDGCLAHELAADLRTVRPVDLAGHARGVGAHPKLDPHSGELHLISSPGERTALLHVISAGGMTRRTRQIVDAPAPILDLAITTDHVILIGNGYAGITRHCHEDTIRWLSAGPALPGRVIDAHDDGDCVVLHAEADVLEQWTLDPSANDVARRPLHGAAQALVRINERFAGSPHRYLYSVGCHRTAPSGSTTLAKHDIAAGTREDRAFGEGRHAGEFLFVDDPERGLEEDGGWLLGLVHTEATTTTCLVVLDAADIAGPVVASVRLPHRVANGLRGLWTPNPA